MGEWHSKKEVLTKTLIDCLDRVQLRKNEREKIKRYF